MPPMNDCESNQTSGKTPRNERFESEQPFHDDPSLSFLGATGTFRRLNPTSALYTWSGSKPSQQYPFAPQRNYVNEHVSSHEGRQRRGVEQEGEREGLLPNQRNNEVLGFIWRSRDDRKGRHALALRGKGEGRGKTQGTLQPTNSLPATLRGIGALFTKFPYWDISWCVAVVYTVGSLVWVVNGFTGVAPLIGNYSSRTLDLTNSWTAFVGSLIFFLGSYLLFLEAINVNSSGCFGWAVERAIKGGRPSAEIHPGDCYYHQQHKNLYSGEEHEGADGNGALHTSDQGTDFSASQAWLWWPSWRDVRTTFIYQLGFIACAIQLVSGSLFFGSKFTALPGVTEHCPQIALDITNLAPQIIGCIGFAAASYLFMLETQPRWHVPAPGVLGWHVGFWKLLGCLGFLISGVCSALGQHGIPFAKNQSNIVSFVGSWTILLGSLIQWYESLEKYPVVQEGSSQYSEWNEEFY